MKKDIAKNKKAFFEFEIVESFEAGVVLSGSEVKALRAGRVNLKDSFVRVIKGEAWLLNAHIAHLTTTHSFFRPDERAPRKLLLHRKQIDRLLGKVTQDGFTLVITSLYFNESNRVKACVALAKGKNLHDKRETIKRREADREARAAIKRAL